MLIIITILVNTDIYFDSINNLFLNMDTIRLSIFTSPLALVHVLLQFMLKTSRPSL